MSELKSPGKPFEISKWAVAEAFEKVRANKGAPGVDGVTIEEFEADLGNNLYKVWNRMSSGSYFPPPMRAVEIPKPHGGGTRMLGLPTVADRVAQTVVAEELAGKVETIFHEDSYGYRPGRSAVDAVGVCWQRCRKTDWVIDLDIQKFFDSVDWDLLLKAVAANTDSPWVLLYVRRWLQAPVQLPDGTLQQRDRGTPQGSPVSPVLANLFLHYAFDTWMVREFPTVRFERYVDDVVVHCVTERQAGQVLAALHDRMEQVGLWLHPDKTRIVYCKDGKRRGDYAHTSFTFLGFTFRARGMRAKNGSKFLAFAPAISRDALTKIGREVRSWRLHHRTGRSFADLARWINPRVRGWMNYYGAFYRSALYPLLTRINAYLMRWVRNKYRRYRGRKAFQQAWQRVTTQYPRYLAHWQWTTAVPAVW
ncbi:group II intron reverse transcriptase/maturase [Mycobacterium talmoniae]|uniref:RNA-directed DNA polymerase n=1 Tax=Mycobacterium talmoniae TaxID=1858794 RepID=A0A1S1ND35_9MYCO|nr:MULTISPECIES: group II intron reverse transcriptase/maturase [Mycobacterium]OHU97410.1 group II intron reverse transcriptase/maturase [Mycobacterium talmoniae]PQM45547.1 Group II intron-encoded protein LtrA [Mycobacterium talmoniae]TDH50649.1 group II intron reverse transcriptase/maturase [Mycobacterium eburneum]